MFLSGCKTYGFGGLNTQPYHSWALAVDEESSPAMNYLSTQDTTVTTVVTYNMKKPAQRRI